MSPSNVEHSCVELAGCFEGTITRRQRHAKVHPRKGATREARAMRACERSACGGISFDRLRFRLRIEILQVLPRTVDCVSGARLGVPQTSPATYFRGVSARPLESSRLTALPRTDPPHLFSALAGGKPPLGTPDSCGNLIGALTV